MKKNDENHSQLKKLNIAMLGHKRIPSREGGIEIVVEELSTRMVKLGYSVTCYNRKGHHVGGKEFDTKNLKEYKGVKLHTVFTIEKKGLAAMSSSVFAALHAAFGRYDVVHFHAEGPCAMLWLPKLFGKRCIATVHGIDWQREKWKSGFASKYIHFGEKVAVKYADEIIVLSKGVQEYFRDTYGRETRFIPNGVNRPRICTADEITQRWGLEKDSYILFLGRLVPEKGLRYLIKAFKRTDKGSGTDRGVDKGNNTNRGVNTDKGIITDKKLVIAGGASDTDSFIQELKELAKDDERIIFTGFVQGKVLDELYSNAYIYTLPSDLEGMPLSLLEAMSYGNCCVVSDIAECAEVVEDKAVKFKKSDVDDLRVKLQMLCDSPEDVQRYKDGAAEFICKKYDWDTITEETIGLYRG